MAQVETKSIGQDELSQILSGNVDSIITPQTEEVEIQEDKVLSSTKIDETIDTNFKWDDLEKVAETTEEETELEETEVKSDEKKEDKKPGRKTAEFVSLVNELVEAGDLIGFDEGEAKTIDDAKELIKLNLKQKDEVNEIEIKEKIFSSYSPQIQAILHYAEKGGQDVTPLLSAIAEVEKTAELDIETEAGQSAILTEYYKTQGWEDEDIKDEIETAKDIDKLKTKAEKLLPKLNQMKGQRLERIMREQEEKQALVEETRKNYLATVQEALSQEKLGDIKLSRQEKSKLWQAVSDTSYKSFNGTNTNAFYKKLEDIQVGKTADYDHFLELVYHAVDREAFKQKIREEIATEQAAGTAKKLKIQQTKATSPGPSYEEKPGPKKPTIHRGFKNPFG